MASDSSSNRSSSWWNLLWCPSIEDDYDTVLAAAVSSTDCGTHVGDSSIGPASAANDVHSKKSGIRNNNNNEDDEDNLPAWDAATKALLLPTTITSAHMSDNLPPFVAQQETWDCGTTCLQMVLLWLHDHSIKTYDDNNSNSDYHSTSTTPTTSITINTHATQTDWLSRQTLIDKVKTQSVWTVDLVWLLDQYILELAVAPAAASKNNPAAESAARSNRPGNCLPRYLFCSQSLQVNPDLQEYTYYTNAFSKDQCRVQSILETFRNRNQSVPLVSSSSRNNTMDNDKTSKNNDNASIAPVSFHNTDTSYCNNSEHVEDGWVFNIVDCRRLIQRKHLSVSEVSRLVQYPHCVAIALIDNSVLLNNDKAATINKRRHGGNSVSEDDDNDDDDVRRQEQYVGHFILLLGVSRDPQHLRQAARYKGEVEEDYCFLMYNPAAVATTAAAPSTETKVAVAPSEQQLLGNDTKNRTSSSPAHATTTTTDTAETAYNQEQIRQTTTTTTTTTQNYLQQQQNPPPFCLSPGLFERAWEASGTDKDILFVTKPLL